MKAVRSVELDIDYSTLYGQWKHAVSHEGRVITRLYRVTQYSITNAIVRRLL